MTAFIAARDDHRTIATIFFDHKIDFTVVNRNPGEVFSSHIIDLLADYSIMPAEYRMYDGSGGSTDFAYVCIEFENPGHVALLKMALPPHTNMKYLL